MADHRHLLNVKVVLAVGQAYRHSGGPHAARPRRAFAVWPGVGLPPGARAAPTLQTLHEDQLHVPLAADA